MFRRETDQDGLFGFGVLGRRKEGGKGRKPRWIPDAETAKVYGDRAKLFDEVDLAINQLKQKLITLDKQNRAIDEYMHPMVSNEIKEVLDFFEEHQDRLQDLGQYFRKTAGVHERWK